jgi:hypothetical protein
VRRGHLSWDHSGAREEEVEVVQKVEMIEATLQITAIGSITSTTSAL